VKSPSTFDSKLFAAFMEQDPLWKTAGFDEPDDRLAPALRQSKQRFSTD